MLGRTRTLDEAELGPQVLPLSPSAGTKDDQNKAKLQLTLQPLGQVS